MAQETRQQQFSAGEGPAVAQQPAPQQPTAQQPAQGAPTTSRPCPQDCTRCQISQQIFCSTKMLFDLSRAYQEARQQIASVEAAIAGIQAQLQPKEGEAPLSTPIIEDT